MYAFELIVGLLVLAASLGLLWKASPRNGNPPPFMRWRGMQVIVPGAILYGLCAAGTLLIKSVFSVLT